MAEVIDARRETPLRAAIVGTGGISPSHAESYRAAGAHLVAVCDVHEPAARRRAAEWDVPQVFTDAAAMFEAVELDVVSICTPASTHHRLVLLAAQAGVHVLCEKPVAVDLHHAQEMIDACRSAGVVFQVAHQMRSDGAVAEARRIVASGELGDLAFVRLRQAHDWGGADAVPPSFATKASGGGGTLLDNGCHLMDLARFFGGDVDEVYARTATRRWPTELEDTSVVSIRYRSGALGSIENSWTATGWEQGFWIYGTRGSLEWTNRDGPPVLTHAFRASPGTAWEATDRRETTYAGDTPNARQTRAFLAAVQGAGPVPCTGEDGLEAVRLVLASYDSARRNLPVRLGTEATSLADL